MPKTGDTCKHPGYYKFSGHIKRTTTCHPTFDESEILMQLFGIFPSINTCAKDAFWTYVRPPN